MKSVCAAGKRLPKYLEALNGVKEAPPPAPTPVANPAQTRASQRRGQGRKPAETAPGTRRQAPRTGRVPRRTPSRPTEARVRIVGTSGCRARGKGCLGEARTGWRRGHGTGRPQAYRRGPRGAYSQTSRRWGHLGCWFLCLIWFCCTGSGPEEGGVSVVPDFKAGIARCSWGSRALPYPDGIDTPCPRTPCLASGRPPLVGNLPAMVHPPPCA
jgi:hypothetical protein